MNALNAPKPVPDVPSLTLPMTGPPTSLRLRQGRRRGACCALPVVVLAPLVFMLAGCASPAPPPLLYQLRGPLQPPATAAALPPPVPVSPASSGAAAALTVQLMLPVTLPELLERDAILVPRGQTGVQPLAGHRWAEPLRDAVPRLLRQDLSDLLAPGQLWAAPMPAGLQVQRQLRVDVLALQANGGLNTGPTSGHPGGSPQVLLQARWTLADPSGRVPVRTGVENLSSPVQGADVDALVAAHRQVLGLLAQQLAQRVRAAPGGP